MEVTDCTQDGAIVLAEKPVVDEALGLVLRVGVDWDPDERVFLGGPSVVVLDGAAEPPVDPNALMRLEALNIPKFEFEG